MNTYNIRKHVYKYCIIEKEAKIKICSYKDVYLQTVQMQIYNIIHAYSSVYFPHPRIYAKIIKRFLLVIYKDTAHLVCICDMCMHVQFTLM